VLSRHSIEAASVLQLIALAFRVPKKLPYSQRCRSSQSGRRASRLGRLGSPGNKPQSDVEVGTPPYDHQKSRRVSHVHIIPYVTTTFGLPLSSTIEPLWPPRSVTEPACQRLGVAGRRWIPLSARRSDDLLSSQIWRSSGTSCVFSLNRPRVKNVEQ
jgi:hypothetical protein